MMDDVSTPTSSPTPTTSAPAIESGATQAPAGAPATGQLPTNKPAPTAPSPEMFDVKVNGRIVKMSKDELINHASMSSAAQLKFKEAREISTKVDKIIKSAKENPIAALMSPELGLTKDQIKDAIEKWYVEEVITPSEMTEEQRRIRELERERDQRLQKDKEFEAQQQALRDEQETAKATEHFNKLFIDALEKSDLPKTPYIVTRLAFYAQQNLKNGFEASMDQLVTQVKSELNGVVGQMTSTATYSQLKNLFGEETIKKILRGSLEEIRANRNKPVVDSYGRQTDQPGPGITEQKENYERVTMDEVNRRLKLMRMGKL